MVFLKKKTTGKRFGDYFTVQNSVATLYNKAFFGQAVMKKMENILLLVISGLRKRFYEMQLVQNHVKRKTIEIK